MVALVTCVNRIIVRSNGGGDGYRWDLDVVQRSSADTVTVV